MDITDSAGRAAYISFIVSLCYCTDYELGYDPTVVWNADKKYWVIKCPDSAAAKDGEMRVVNYYARDPIFEAERLFGQHTRGFAASLDPNLVDEPDTFIKDSWPHASADPQSTLRNELDILQDIEKQLGGKSMDTLGVIRATNGGTVCFSKTGNLVNDNTSAMLDPVFGGFKIALSQTPAVPTIGNRASAEENLTRNISLRVHRRLALQPLGRPLHTLKSPYELIIVLADVMVAHSTILKKSGYLHRDISPNNIMVVDDGERVRGLLIDFDHAIKTDKSRLALAEHAGTLPFMSICNLQNSEIQRSELDDWESLLYVVCWLGVHGVSHDEQVAYQQEIDAARKVGEYYRYPLAKWNLLQLQKSTEQDIDIMFDVCDLLNPAQIKKLLSIYAVSDYENPIIGPVMNEVLRRASPTDKTDKMLLDSNDLSEQVLYLTARKVPAIETYIPPEFRTPRIRALVDSQTDMAYDEEDEEAMGEHMDEYNDYDAFNQGVPAGNY
ncbi:hypothetical protein IW148_006079 [Coemansia sp. RSA 1199]|nr:hypothetical protein IW148_006079 [Coemansia sp. RSA 1199]